MAAAKTTITTRVIASVLLIAFLEGKNTIAFTCFNVLTRHQDRMAIINTKSLCYRELVGQTQGINKVTTLDFETTPNKNLGEGHGGSSDHAWEHSQTIFMR